MSIHVTRAPTVPLSSYDPSYIPFPGTVNAVIGLDFSSNGICKYADCKSIFEINLADRSVSRILLF